MLFIAKTDGGGRQVGGICMTGGRVVNAVGRGANVRGV